MAATEINGWVVGDKMDKTVVVLVERKVKHPKYEKYILCSKKYKAHDEDNKCLAGDKVRIKEARPLSRTKRWRVIEILRKSLKTNTFHLEQQDYPLHLPNAFPCYGIAEIPEEVLIGIPFSLRVSLQRPYEQDPSYPDAWEFRPINITIYVVVSPLDFQVNEKTNIRGLVLKNPRKNLPVADFQLTPNSKGNKPILIDFYQNTRYLGGFQVEASVVEN